MPKKLLVRFPVSSNALIQPGTPLNAGHFQPGQFVDVISKTSRKGFHGMLYALKSISSKLNLVLAKVRH